MKREIGELMTNQKHILVAISYLNEQMEDKAKNDKTKQVENILESQAMIDELIVKKRPILSLLKI